MKIKTGYKEVLTADMELVLFFSYNITIRRVIVQVLFSQSYRMCNQQDDKYLFKEER